MVRRLSIATKNFEVEKLAPNWAQKIVLEEIQSKVASKRPIRLITLKARQIGVSTITQAFMYVMSFAFPRSVGLTIANEADNSQHLLSMSDLYWETDPFKSLYRTKYQAKNTLMWHETLSSMRTTTAGNKEAGRSKTVRFLHASEVAFWDDPEKVMTGLLQSVPERPMTMIALESTANGVGNYFYNTWQSAMVGDNSFTPLFFPWWSHYEYRASYIGLPVYDLSPLDAEERALLALWKNGLQVASRTFSIKPSEFDDALAWRRHQIKDYCQGDINKFHQEYPSTPEEAFIATGTNVFPLQKLTECFKPEPGRKGRLFRKGNRVEFQPDITGPLTIYRYPSPDTDFGMYVIGGDATATLHGDHAALEVFNRRTLEQSAEWRGRIDPASLAEEEAKLGMYYNQALVSQECEGPGFATVGALQQMDYPNLYQMQLPDQLPGRYTGKFGWSMSYKTKALAIGFMLKLLVDTDITIHSRILFQEMRDYVTLEGGGYGPADAQNGFDDTVMASCIAVTSHALSPALLALGLTNQPEGAPVWEAWEQGPQSYVSNMSYVEG